MEHLYAPWRSAYFTERAEGCVFCRISQTPGEDAANQVLYRDEHCFAVMNRYPYTPGHFMIIPHAHLSALEALPAESWQHIALLAQSGVRLLREHFGAHGVNIGMNLGECGGAGIAEHIHLHLVPRFSRDTNFITAIGDTRVNPSSFEVIYQQLLSGVKTYFANPG